MVGIPESFFHNLLVLPCLCACFFSLVDIALHFRHIGIGVEPGIKGGKEVDAHHNAREILGIGSQAPATVERLVGIEILGCVHMARTLKRLFGLQVPSFHIIRYGTVVKVDEVLVLQIFGIARPFIHLQARLHHVEVGIQVVPEGTVVLIIGRRRLVVAVYLPVGTPVLGLADILRKTEEHILVVRRHAQNLSAHTLMRDVSHTESLSHGQRRLVPVAHRIVPFMGIEPRHSLGPVVSLLQIFVGRSEHRHLCHGRTVNHLRPCVLPACGKQRQRHS